MEALRDRQRTDRTSAATLPSDGRAHNLSLVRQTLHSAGAMSRAELSRVLGLTRVTVSDLVSDLLERGHVVELGQSDEVRPGKPAILVDINRRGLQVIGMDLAENSVLRAAVLDLDGNILERVERSISEETGPDVVNEVLELASEAVGRATATLLGIGVGTPASSMRRRGHHGPQLRMDGRRPARSPPGADRPSDPRFQRCRRRSPCGPHFRRRQRRRNPREDRPRCRFRTHRGRQACPGAHSAAGEIGHVTVGTDGGTVCKCGKTGCLETWMSVPSLERALAEAAASSEPEAAAAVVLREAGERLAIALAPVVGALDLGEVVLSGPRELLEGPFSTPSSRPCLSGSCTRTLHRCPSVSRQTHRTLSCVEPP
ncbi:putative xylose repressor [Arthrobacter sp. Hiyo8]|nr:putative xylose repressor [Arthrobacter sp. Hiyo8]